MDKANILIVEDNNIVMLELQDRLFEMGYNVVGTASSALEAIEKAGQHYPDLTMMDIRLKGEMDGIDAAARIKKDFNIPVVYLTAHTDNDTLQRAKITEPYGYIIKPFEERELHSTIEMALYKHSIEKKLRENEHWLSSTLKSIGDALIATDPHGIIKLINPIALEITGWKYEEAFGKNINEIFIIKDDKTSQLIESPVSLSLKNNSIFGASNKILISKDGHEVPIDFSSAPINYNATAPAGAVLVFRDISERIKSKRIIEKQRIFLRNIIDTDPNYISVKNAEGKFELANKAIAEALGTATETLQGKYDSEFFSDDEIMNQRKIDLEVINSFEEKFIPEEKLIDSTGKVHLLQTFKRAIDSQEGNQKLVLSVASDITLQKQTEIALRQSEERIKTLLKAIPEIVLRFNRSGVLLDYHTQDTENFISTTDKIIGNKINNLFENELAEKILYYSEKAFDSDKMQIFEYEFIKGNDISYKEVRVINNEQNEFIIIVRDITKIKISQEELKALNVSKDKFFSIIAHDLRGPFTTLLGLSEYLATEIAAIPKDELVVISKNMFKAAKSTFNLLENLLQWSRVKTGRFNYNPEEIKIENIIHKMVDLYTANASNKNINIRTELPKDLIVYADINMMETILRNLISNAIKFTNIDGIINISTFVESEFAVIKVQDNGIGIPDSVKSKLFKIDQNISTQGTQNEEGSGLGLLLCKEFIEINKGKLIVESEVGKGSIFTFFLPLFSNKK